MSVFFLSFKTASLGRKINTVAKPASSAGIIMLVQKDSKEKKCGFINNTQFNNVYPAVSAKSTNKYGLNMRFILAPMLRKVLFLYINPEVHVVAIHQYSLNIGIKLIKN